MTTMTAAHQVEDLATLPDSAVPAAFDRGHLYSPTTTHLAWALDPGYGYDYRPGNDFEPLPEAPRGPKDWAWWRKNHAMAAVADFLGLRVGDEISLYSLQGSHTLATVTATYRHHAVVRYPMPKGAQKPYAENWVNRRNAEGHWY
ncbi:hypothetical protein [Streptomyces sp. NPDC058297]|uniref:hypothetical protein n=1 Tax=Streptomyces sp. NPDC058297 TaxID=3346433 RepID=UPI0036E64A03